MSAKHFYPLSFSSLKAFAQSPAHFVAYKNRQHVETPAMRFGTAVHAAVLEPEKFAEEYRELKVRRGTAAHKALVEEHPNAKWLAAGEWHDLQAITKAVQRHPKAIELLATTTDFEQELHGTLYGHQLRGFADMVGPNWVCDLKTCQMGAPRDFTSTAYRTKYHMQAFIYMNLMQQSLGRACNEFWWVTVEKAAPYVVTVYRANDDLIEAGQKECERLLNEFGQWDGVPRGYDHHAQHDGFFDLGVPYWAAT